MKRIRKPESCVNENNVERNRANLIAQNPMAFCVTYFFVGEVHELGPAACVVREAVTRNCLIILNFILVDIKASKVPSLRMTLFVFNLLRAQLIFPNINMSRFGLPMIQTSMMIHYERVANC